MTVRNVHLYDPSETLRNLETVEYEKKEHIAYITFKRPEVLNALNDRMGHELYSIWLDARRDDDVWVAIVTGTGRGFQVGRDLKELVEYQSRGEIAPRDDPKSVKYRRDAFARNAEFNKPIVAAINGIVAGSGLLFVGEAHIRVMADDAYMTDGHPNFGNLGQPQRLIQDFGWTAAMYMWACYGRLSAQDCYRLGIVTEICPKENVLQRAISYAEMMCQIRPSILQHGIQLANLTRASDPAVDQLSLLLNLAHRPDVDPEGAEQGRSFGEKKRPAR